MGGGHSGGYHHASGCVTAETRPEVLVPTPPLNDDAGVAPAGSGPPGQLQQQTNSQSNRSSKPPFYRPLPVRPPSVEQSSTGVKCNTSMPTKAKLITYGVALGVVALLIFLLIPREPQWEVLSMEFSSFQLSVLSGGLSGLVGWDFGGDESAVKITVSTTVRATNPNMIGANADPGVMSILYGNHTIGKAMTTSVSIGPYASVDMKVNVSIDSVPAKLGISMVHELETHDNQLSVGVWGSVIAHVWRLAVMCKIHCELVTDVRTMPAKTVFTKKDCSYTYDLPPA
eukprot:TRINITY_DN52273_c0_g1_i1.p1 TRINITY_DN52273_c0_g1~~TRINITY_DN52273_c0_g1_i1.p1  ORF type:complete len:285 (-),score=39.23 TRINITY_DN52273_c0_g1_i1:145-999(-)